MKDGKPETVGECLKVMEGNVPEERKWQALAILLRDRLLGEGVSMDSKVSGPGELEVGDSPRKEAVGIWRKWFMSGDEDGRGLGC